MAKMILNFGAIVLPLQGGSHTNLQDIKLASHIGPIQQPTHTPHTHTLTPKKGTNSSLVCLYSCTQVVHFHILACVRAVCVYIYIYMCACLHVPGIFGCMHMHLSVLYTPAPRL